MYLNNHCMNIAEEINERRISIEDFADFLKREIGDGRLTSADKERLECAVCELDTAIYVMMEAMSHIYKAHHYARPYMVKLYSDRFFGNQ